LPIPRVFSQIETVAISFLRRCSGSFLICFAGAISFRLTELSPTSPVGACFAEMRFSRIKPRSDVSPCWRLFCLRDLRRRLHQGIVACTNFHQQCNRNGDVATRLCEMASEAITLQGWLLPLNTSSVT
jgi:hypothetical protein